MWTYTRSRLNNNARNNRAFLSNQNRISALTHAHMQQIKSLVRCQPLLLFCIMKEIERVKMAPKNRSTVDTFQCSQNENDHNISYNDSAHSESYSHSRGHLTEKFKAYFSATLIKLWTRVNQTFYKHFDIFRMRNAHLAF